MSCSYFDRILFLNRVKWPLWADFDNPERYGLARESVVVILHILVPPRNPDPCPLIHSESRETLSPASKTRNLQLRTPDGETLGAWHVL